jgi:hypothetical protein
MHAFLCIAVRGSDRDESGARFYSVHALHIPSKSKHERSKQLKLPSPFGNVALAPRNFRKLNWNYSIISIQYYKLRLREVDMDADFRRGMLLATKEFAKSCTG